MPMSKDKLQMRLLGFFTYFLLAVFFSGCSQLSSLHPSDVEQQQQAVHEAERERIWESNQAWLLSRLPRAVEVVHQVIKALDDYPGKERIERAGGVSQFVTPEGQSGRRGDIDLGDAGSEHRSPGRRRQEQDD